MAILAMFYSIVIPIENLKKILTKEELQKALLEMSYNGNAWFDDYLYREGSMSPMDNEMMIKFWKDKGLVPTEIKNGKKYWKDLCLVDVADRAPTLPCDWIEMFCEDDLNYINLRGKPRGLLVKDPVRVEDFITRLYDSKELDIDRQKTINKNIEKENGEDIFFKDIAIPEFKKFCEKNGFDIVYNFYEPLIEGHINKELTEKIEPIMVDVLNLFNEIKSKQGYLYLSYFQGNFYEYCLTLEGIQIIKKSYPPDLLSNIEKEEGRRNGETRGNIIVLVALIFIFIGLSFNLDLGVSIILFFVLLLFYQYIRLIIENKKSKKENNKILQILSKLLSDDFRNFISDSSRDLPLFTDELLNHVSAIDQQKELDKVIEKNLKKIKKQEQRNGNPVIFDMELDEENFPVLRKWALKNPETLEKQVKSIANAWHEGNVISAMQAFESDLEHSSN